MSPSRSGTWIDWMTPPYVMILTSIPAALVSVYSSTSMPSEGLSGLATGPQRFAADPWPCRPRARVVDVVVKHSSGGDAAEAKDGEYGTATRVAMLFMHQDPSSL